MKVLIACEESQTVCKAFREKGHQAYSCDILPCSGGHPEWHYQCDVRELLYFNPPFSHHWDLMIAHPPCTYLSAAVGGKLYDVERLVKTREAFEFVKTLYNAPIAKICIENPTGWLNSNWKKPTQIIHPWYFGDKEMKRTCLWLKNLPRLNGKLEVAKNIPTAKPQLAGHYGGIHKRPKYFMSLNRSSEVRSKTFPGIAQAMADQWG